MSKNFTKILYKVVSLSPGDPNTTLEVSLEKDVYPILGEAGGVMHIKTEIAGQTGYRMVFVKAKVKFERDAVSVSHKGSRADGTFEPGDPVKISVSIDKSKLKHNEAAETFFAAITVTDVSSLLKVPKRKLQPSLPAMVLLEQDTHTLGKSLFAQRDEPGTFDYAHEYLDNQYDVSEGASNYSMEDIALSRFLGMQKWRGFYTEEIRMYHPPLPIRDELGIGFENICFRRRSIFPMIPMPMPPVPGGNGGDTVLMDGPVDTLAPGTTDKGGDLNIEKDMSDPLGHEKLTIAQQHFDFSGVVNETDFESYAHQLRPNYNKLGTRVDFTETILFVPLKQLKGDGNVVTFEADKFFLSDQVSQYEISVDLVSSKGRFGIWKKTFTSALPLYAKFNLPTSMVIGDKMNIPFTVYSAMDKAIDFDYLILERELSEDGKINVLHMVEKRNQRLQPKSQLTIDHVVDSSRSSLKSNKGMIYV